MNKKNKYNIADIQKFKNIKNPFTAITAYDFPTALIIDKLNIPIVLVGDSASMVVYGYDNTIPITMEEMLLVTKAVSRGINKALIVGDMPFMSYQPSNQKAVYNAGRLIKEGQVNAVKLEGGIEYLNRIYKNIDKNIFRTFDFANFLRGHDKFSDSIKLYSDILSTMKSDNIMYPRILDRRGTAYERNGNWELAEKDLLLSLKIEPNQAYTLNYLAYTWIEQNKKTKEALSMLEKANKLKKNDGYITDSLGWAQYKLKNFNKAKFHLERAIQMMPDDPVVNDHFADCLWMIDKKIQARYYWEYVLTLEDTEDELKKKIQNKLLFGLEKI